MPAWLMLLCGVYAAVVAFAALQLSIGAERFGWTGILMFLPQLLWAIPGVVLTVIVLWRSWKWVWLPLALLAFVLGPLTGFRWNSQSVETAETFRVMTYNVQIWQQRRNIRALIAEIEEAEPDVLCLQDARGAMNGRLGEFLHTWHVAGFGQYVIATKFPVVDSVVGDISYDGERHTYLRARIDVGDRPVTVLTAHFATPRDALNVLRTPSMWRQHFGAINKNLARRIKQANAIVRDARAVEGAVIVAGDFNAPPQSVFSRMMADLGLVDAFAEAGRGYGYTFGHTLLDRPFLRIDRIFVSSHFVPIRTTVGGANGSDHRPVMADLAFR